MSLMTNPETTIHAARRGPRPMTAEDLWTIPRVGPPAPSPDGAWCIVPVTTHDLETNEAKSRLYRVAVSGGEAMPLTAPEHSSASPAVSPDGRRVAFTRKDAKGKAQLHVMPLDGGESRRLTDFPLGCFDPRWLPDGSAVIVAAEVLKGHFTPEATRAELERREKDPVKAHVTEERFYRHWDRWLTTGEVPHLFRCDLTGGAVVDLTPVAETWLDWMEPNGQYDVSPDGREVAYAGISFDPAKGPRSAIYVAPTAGGAVTCLTPEHPSNDLKPRYSLDGRSLVYGMQHDPFFYADRVRLMRFDRGGRTHAPLLADWDRSPLHWEFAADGTLCIEAEDRARVSLFTLKGEGEPKLAIEGGTLQGITVRGTTVFGAIQNLSAPAEAFVWSPGEKAHRRFTRFTEEAMSRFGLGEVREITFEGSKGETVQMFVLMPPGAQAGVKLPLIQCVHGGPHGISGDNFHPRWNGHLFAAPGYVVSMVNFQGSTSWGQDFAKRILGGWGDRPFEDVMLGTDLLVASGLVDENRMAAAGGSYGGFMASWIEGNTKRFRCIVNHAGVYDTLSQYASDWTFGRAESFGGEPWDGIEEIDRYNPARYAKGFETPMLVLHGERDYRVPATQGLECYGVLKAKGVPARLVYFPDENHWILKPRNSLLWYREVLAWFERWLGSGTAS